MGQSEESYMQAGDRKCALDGLDDDRATQFSYTVLKTLLGLISSHLTEMILAVLRHDHNHI